MMPNTKLLAPGLPGHHVLNSGLSPILGRYMSSVSREIKMLGGMGSARSFDNDDRLLERHLFGGASWNRTSDLSIISAAL
jgi:hypothetical protein